MNITRNTCTGLNIDQTLAGTLMQQHITQYIKTASVSFCSSCSTKVYANKYRSNTKVKHDINKDLPFAQ